MENILGHIKPFVPFPVKWLTKKLIGSRYYRIINPHWYKNIGGGMWGEIGKLRFDFIVEHGLRPDSYILDVGCGALRGGIHFIQFLKPGHYFGIDIRKERLEAAKIILKKYKLAHKNQVLVHMVDFNFQSLNQTFDYALAQSVFTHLPLNSIIRCIMNIADSTGFWGW